VRHLQLLPGEHFLFRKPREDVSPRRVPRAACRAAACPAARSNCNTSLRASSDPTRFSATRDLDRATGTAASLQA
jgi:hypothetical protein